MFLKELLDSASAGTLQVTHDVQSALPLGASQVTWSAWTGAPDAGRVVATRQAWIYVFPFGKTSAATSGRHDATAGNHAAQVVRDRSVHVVWLEIGRQGKGPTVAYRTGVQDPTTGRFAWDTPIFPISDPGLAASMMAKETSPNAVHFA